MADMKSALIFGLNGAIGRALSAHLHALGVAVYGTVSPRSERQPESLVMELTDRESLLHTALPHVDAAFYCAGVTRLAACVADPAGSRLVNVEAPAILCRRLTAEGTHFLYLSSSCVFDGSRPYIPATAPYAPRTEYGRQKAAAETALCHVRGQISLVRLTKVLGPGSLLESWMCNLRAGVPIRPFSDLSLAPVSLERTVHLLARIGAHASGGLWQISGAEDVSYAQLACSLAVRMGVEPGLVLPWTVAESGVSLEHAPRYTSLDAGRLRELAGDVSGALDEVSPECPDAVLDTLK